MSSSTADVIGIIQEKVTLSEKVQNVNNRNISFTYNFLI